MSSVLSPFWHCSVVERFWLLGATLCGGLCIMAGVICWCCWPGLKAIGFTAASMCHVLAALPCHQQL